MRTFALALVAVVNLTAAVAAYSVSGPIRDGADIAVTALGGAVGGLLPARFGHSLNLVDDFGAKADATGEVGAGTDDTAALRSALAVPSREITIPAGSYRFTGSVPMADHTTIVCQGGATTLYFDDPTGTADFLTVHGGPGRSATVNTIAVRHCTVLRTAPARAGALFHATDTYRITLEDNRLGWDQAIRSWDGVKVDCTPGGQPINQVMFLRNYISGSLHDGVDLSCPTAGNTMADIFFEQRNYISNSQHAAVEMKGSVGWVHFDDVDFDQNPGTAVLGDETGAAFGQASVTVRNSHFEGNGDDIDLTGYSFVGISGDEFVTKGGITCTGCSQGVSGSNSYTGDTGLKLMGVQGWTESGSHWSTSNDRRPGMVLVGPNGSIPSQSISIDGGEHLFTYVPFLTFLGAAHPAVGMSLAVNSQQGSCWAGSNVHRPSFAYRCQGNVGPTSASDSFQGDLSFVSPGKALMGNLYFQDGWKYYANGQAAALTMSDAAGHAMDFVFAPKNGAGADASAPVGVGGYVADDGSFQWGTSRPCGGGCGAFGRIDVGRITASGPIHPAQSTVADLPRCTPAEAGALLEATDAASPAYNTAVRGGGVDLIPVVCTGSRWVAH